MLIVSLIPLFLNKHGDDALGEREYKSASTSAITLYVTVVVLVYCINNYSLIVGFDIPRYNTTFDVVLNTTQDFDITGGIGSFGSCTLTTLVNTSESVSTSSSCTFQLLSIIYPRTPNAKVFDNYALSEACYRTLQTCYYDPLLTSCLLSDCVAVEVVDTTINASYPLTNYRLRCAAKIYYKTRCLDSPASYHLYYSSSQQNSACRQRRLDRINTCFNSTVQLLNVPCLISVSSGRVTNTNTKCSQTITPSVLTLQVFRRQLCTQKFPVGASPSSVLLGSTFASPVFTASDQDDGHVYRISSVHSEYYNSSQPGALYCGGVTLTQIASSITAAIYSQT